MNTHLIQPRYMRIHEVIAYTGLSRSSIYRIADFPVPVKLGPNSTRWIAAEVRAWADARDNDRRTRRPNRQPAPVSTSTVSSLTDRKARVPGKNEQRGTAPLDSSV